MFYLYYHQLFQPGCPAAFYSLSCFSTIFFPVHLLDSHHRQVDVGGIQLQVDLPVDCSLAVLVEVLSHLRTHGSETQQTKILLDKQARLKFINSYVCITQGILQYKVYSPNSS